jgi:hypothetical protein
VFDFTLPPRAAKPEETTMKREYVAVLDGDGRFPDEVVASCEASSRHVAENKLDPKRQGLYLLMTRRQADARGIQDFRDIGHGRFR